MDFNPEILLNKETILSIYGQSGNSIKKMCARVTSSLQDEKMDALLIDGNESTVWEAKQKKGYITIAFENPVDLKGLSIALTKRGTQPFTIFTSENGKDWIQLPGVNVQTVSNKQILFFEKNIVSAYIRIQYDGFIPSIAELDIILADVLPTEG